MDKLTCAIIFLSLVYLCQGASLSQERIIGGHPAALGQFPYTASLRYVANGNHFCGGTIISSRWVLSAAHCTGMIEPEIWNIVVGMINRFQGIVHDVKQIINHEKFNASTLSYDVSVIEVQTPFIFNENVRAIAVGSSFIGGGVVATVSGWGVAVVSYILYNV